MKLIRFGSPDHEKEGVLLDDGRRIDVSGFGSDYDEGFFGGDGLDRLATWVNGVTRQNSNTAQMIFGVPELVSYISQFMTLLPGDVISTGTPQGVGLGLKPEPVFLKPGDVVELGIAGLGESCQVARAFTGVAC
jgi:2-keto-4-pentenoate hydratase/2-oxohepta-3-ene-1,7-dioic acid hydratase in catechol pathway